MKLFELGKEYTFQRTKSDVPGKTITVKLSTAADLVTVPYGTFDCYKVYINITVTGLGLVHTETAWYAENLGLIKRISDDSLWELVSYVP